MWLTYLALQPIPVSVVRFAKRTQRERAYVGVGRVGYVEDDTADEGSKARDGRRERCGALWRDMFK